LLKIVLAAALAGSLALLAAINAHRLGGQYILRDGDHQDVMVADPAAVPTRIVRVLFVGNSFTFVNDLPAMVVNLAASDAGNRVRLEVKAMTFPGAHLNELLQQSDVLAWVRAHRIDYVVLQEQSGWYQSPEQVENTAVSLSNWLDELRTRNESPLLFEVWSDATGSDIYTDQGYSTFGSTPEAEAERILERTQELSRRFAIPIVPVGAVFERARHTSGAPELLGPDHHHASVAGTYLAALVFYRAFTGRTGAEAGYRPWGMTKADAKILSAINAE